MEAKLHAEQAQMESKIKTEKAKIQATNAALEADLDLLATKGEAAAAEALCCLCFGTFLSGCTCGARITPAVMSSRL
jgi:hypothetical protein